MFAIFYILPMISAFEIQPRNFGSILPFNWRLTPIDIIIGSLSNEYNCNRSVTGSCIGNGPPACSHFNYTIEKLVDNDCSIVANPQACKGYEINVGNKKFWSGQSSTNSETTIISGHYQAEWGTSLSETHYILTADDCAQMCTDFADDCTAFEWYKTEPSEYNPISYYRCSLIYEWGEHSGATPDDRYNVCWKNPSTDSGIGTAGVIGTASTATTDTDNISTAGIIGITIGCLSIIGAIGFAAYIFSIEKSTSISGHFGSGHA